jgi:hypothetical protein
MMTICAHFTGLLGTPGLELSATSDRIELSCAVDPPTDEGYIRFAFDTPEGRAGGSGRYLIVLRKIEGDWKIVVDMDFSALDSAG